MALEVEPRIEYLLIISKIPTGKNKTDWSQQIYVHIHIKKKELSVEMVGSGSVGRKEVKDVGH